MAKFFNSLLGIEIAFAQTAAEKVVEDSNIFSLLFSKLPLWITAVIIFVLSLVAGAMVKSLVENRLSGKMEEDMHQEVLIISGRIAFVIVAAIGTTIALAIAGIDLTALLAAVGFGISFGMQDTISNFVAGLAILASRPFTIGDWIKVDGKTGKVVEIRTRATYLQTFDGHRLIVPNASLYKNNVLSYTSNPMRRIKIPLYCRYGINIQNVMAIALKEAKKHPKILMQPKPYVVVTELEDSYITLEIRCWVDSKSLWRRIQSQIFVNIQTKLEEAGLDAPYAVTSISFEPDAESIVLKNKMLDSNEFVKMMNERMVEEQKYAQKRQEILNSNENVANKQTAGTPQDQSGQNFLQNNQGFASQPQMQGQFSVQENAQSVQSTSQIQITPLEINPQNPTNFETK